MPGEPSTSNYGEVILNGVRLPLAAESNGVAVAVVGTFPPKQVIGDVQRDDHQLLSSFIQSDWSGGGQIERVYVDTDLGRFWWSTLDTRWPHLLTLLPLTYTVAGPNTTGAYPLGDLNGTFYACYGTALRSLSGATPPVLAGSWTLAALPVNKAVPYQGSSGSVKLFIPEGTNGYDSFDGATVTHNAQQAQAFCLWDDKLYCLASDGSVWYTTDAATWVATGLKLDASHLPRNLLVFYDRWDNPTMQVVTDHDLWALDPAGSLFRTELQFPPHPYQALGSCVWRGSVYVSVGVGVHRYTGSVITATGPDRDDGLPIEFRGQITDLAPGYNELYALIQGTQTAGTASETFTLDAGPALESSLYFPQMTGLCSLLAWTGDGWHTLWVAPNSGASPTWALVSGSTPSMAYRLWWGFNGSLYYQDLPVDFHNPRHSTINDFMPSGRLESGDMDAGMIGVDKLLAAFETITRDLTATETVTLSYSTDKGQTWTVLPTIATGPATTKTKQQLPPNPGALPDGTAAYGGVLTEQVRWRIDLARDPNNTKVAPKVESMALAFVKVMGTLRSFQFIVDLKKDAAFQGMGMRDLETFLDNQLTSKQFVPFAYREDYHMVRVSGISGQDAEGRDLRGNRMVSLVTSFEL